MRVLGVQMRIWRWSVQYSSVSLFLGMCVTLAGCSDVALSFRQNTVESVQQAGETHIALLAVEPWADVVSDISADFKLTPAGAFEAALPRVSSFEEQLLTVFAAKLGLGLPQDSVTAERTVSQADGAVSGQETESEQPGQLPGGDVLPEITERRAKDLPEHDAATRKGVLDNSDPHLKYQAANALYQYVQVLQRLVKTTPKYDGYKPYLVTFQITSAPYARHQPYDVYLNLSFYPKVATFSGADGGSGRVSVSPADDSKVEQLQYELLPIVVPVMITDNLQGQSVARAAELIRQFSGAIQGLTGGVAGALGINLLSDRSAAVFGTDLTSTFTIGRTAQNGLTAILGATRNPVSDYSMVRRTHNVSVLIMVPDAIAEAPSQFRDSNKKNSDQSVPSYQTCSQDVEKCLERRLIVYFSTELRRPDKVGDVLALQSLRDPGSIERARSIISSNRLESECRIKDDEALGRMIRTIPEGNYARFLREVKSACPAHRYPSLLFHLLIDVYGNSPGFRSTTIVLPKIKKPTPDKRELSMVDGSHLAAAFDDGVSQMIVEVAGVVGKPANGTIATLELVTKDGVRVPINATKIGVAKSKLVAVFQSAKALGVTNVAAGKGRLVLRSPGKPKSEGGEPEWEGYAVDGVVYTVAAAKKSGDANKKGGRETVVTVKPDGVAEIKIPIAEAGAGAAGRQQGAGSGQQQGDGGGRQAASK